jgi:hypothetical protein
MRVTESAQLLRIRQTLQEGQPLLPGTVVPSVLFGHGLPVGKIWRNMSHADLVLATLYTKNGPVSVEQEIGKDLDRLMAARCCDQLTERELAQANIDTARRLTATNNPQLREIGRLFIDYREMKDEEADNE